MSDTASETSTVPRRPRPPALRLDHLGVPPETVVGKTLIRIRPSLSHPALTLDFADSTSYQILVDGYNPLHPGIPKQLEYDSFFQNMLEQGHDLQLEVVNCALITLSDRGYEKRQFDSHDLVWDQQHLGVAFKFAEPDPTWHCVWAMLEDRDQGSCVFRSYDDVYLQPLQRSPRKAGHHRTFSSSPKKQRTPNPWA